MKLRIITCIGFLCIQFISVFFNIARGQTFTFKTTEVSEKLTAAQIKAHGFPYTLTVRNDNWYDMTVTHPTTWNNSTGYKFKSNHSFIKFYVNHAYPYKIAGPYTYKLLFTTYGYANPSDTTQEIVTTDTLTISYKSDSLAAFQDMQAKKYSNFYKTKIILNEILDCTSGTPTPLTLSTLTNLNFNVESSMLFQKYDKKVYGYNEQLTPSLDTSNLSKNYVGLSWTNSSSGAITPVNYELEWTYVDNYSYDISSGTSDSISASNLRYDFAHNSTRVWLDTNYYRIPMIYGKGYLAYRVRMVRPDSSEFRYPIYSKWSVLYDDSTISSLNANSRFRIRSPHVSDSLNWQYTISFAEQGKYKHVLSYFDGLLKNRQSITRFNSTPNKLIVTGSVFDYEGTPAIQILPTPVDTAVFKYQHNLSLNQLTNQPYKAHDFDSIANCGTETLVPPLDSVNALPSKYYSHRNADTANYQKYVPDAEGYPFVQTRYEPGFSDRIEKQGGAGAPLQIGNGHVISNDYVSADQSNLNLLFGANAGYDGFYRNTVTKDPNGQFSISIKDYENKQVASSMIGTGPNSNEIAIKRLENIPDSAYYSHELISGSTQQLINHSKILDKSFYMDVNGVDTIQYLYSFTPYLVCDAVSPHKYLSIAGHYHFYIADNCGVQEFDASGVLGTTGVVTSGATSTSPSTKYTVSLDQGKHLVHKVLTFKEDDINAAVDSFLINPGICLHDEPWFIRKSVEADSFPCPAEDNPCEAKRKEMMAELWPGAKYGMYIHNTNGIVIDTTNNSIFTNVLNSSATYNDTVGYDENVNDPDIGKGIYNPNYPPGHANLNGHVKYRYQDTCLSSGSGFHLPDSVIKNGIVYHNIASMSADSFIFVFNDQIAAALLPLHPEFCKLKHCFPDLFKDAFLDVPDYTEAQTNNLFYLDSIIAHDPLKDSLVSNLGFSSGSVKDSLATFKGGVHRLDTLAMTNAYCGCSDTVMLRSCTDTLFKHEIATQSFVNNSIKDIYFTQIKELYLQNRERFIYQLIGGNADSCGPCSVRRMTLTGIPIFPNTLNANGSVNTAFADGFGAYSHLLSTTSSGMTQDSISYYNTVAQNTTNTFDSLLCNGQIDSIIKRLGNCGNGSTTKLDSIKDYLQYLCTNNLVIHGNYTPEQIRAAIVYSGASLDEYCNPYMVNYDALNTTATSDHAECEDGVFYSDLLSFLNDATHVIPALEGAMSNPSSLSSSYTLSGGNKFEDKLISLVGSTVKVNAYCDTAKRLYTLNVIKNSGGTTLMDTVKIFLKSRSHQYAVQKAIFNDVTAGTSVSFIDVFCPTQFNEGIGSGYINSFSFGVTVLRSTTGSGDVLCQMVGWTDSINTMLTPDNHGLSGCIPCTQMRDAYSRFTDTLSAYGIKGADHPCYEQMLRSYMNYNLKSLFATDDYTRFIESCALADSMNIDKYVAYSWIQFRNSTPSSLLTAVEDFKTGLNSLDSDIYLDPMVQYKNSTDTVMLIYNFAGQPLHKLYKIRAYLASTSYSWNSSVLSRHHNDLYNPTSSSRNMGMLFRPANDTIYFPPTSTPSNFEYGTAISDSLWNGVKYEAYKLYYLNTPTGTSLANKSLNTYLLDTHINDSLRPYYFYPSKLSTVDEDYSDQLKKDFLSYTYKFQTKPPYVVLDSLREDLLQARISSYSSEIPSYQIPYTLNTQPKDLYISNSAGATTNFTDKLQYVFNTSETFNASSSYKSAFYFPSSSTRAITSVSSPNTLNAYLCSDGSYWFRYFKSGDTLFNTYVKIPKYIPKAEHYRYRILDFEILPGNGQTRYFKLRLKDTLTAKTISVKGLTDYVIGNNKVFEDVLLSHSLLSTSVKPVDSFDNCERQKLLSDIYNGKTRYQQYIDSVRTALRSGFWEHIQNASSEKLTNGYIDQKFLFTLYYYDRAGNLIRTVPPEGVNKFNYSVAKNKTIDSVRDVNSLTTSAFPQHDKISYYDYNSINKIIKQKTPDGGNTQFYYDNIGRLIFSQNDKQKPMGNYTYTLYDNQNRIIESGQSKLGCAYFEPYPVGVSSPPSGCFLVDYSVSPHLYVPYPSILTNYVDNHTSVINLVRSHSREDVVLTVYDTMATNLSLIDGMSEQENLRKRVSCVKYFEFLTSLDSTYKNYTHATHYSYDIGGNVKYLVQDFKPLQSIGQRYKRIDYDYDLISGKVNLVSYNRSFPDQFYQRYAYDDDNRITKVETSADGYLWKKDAGYEYFEHGPLARTELGDLRVQGVDYAYTIQGWLKAVNGDTITAGVDMGHDADASSVFACDATGQVLDYFDGDYKSISGRKVSVAPTVAKDLYNGNIARQNSAMLPFLTLSKQYIYDQLNRISEADYATIDQVNHTLHQITDYKNTYKYDMDGNILKLNRNGNNATYKLMDSMKYFYNTNNNQLVNVTDTAADHYDNDIKKYSDSTTTRFLYDPIGNISKDLVSKQDTITWNLYNKVIDTRNDIGKNSLHFSYDGAGNRVAKYFTQYSDTNMVKNNDYYVRDASGNILAVYHDKQEYRFEDWLSNISATADSVMGTENYLNDFVSFNFSDEGAFAARVQAVAADSLSKFASILNKPAGYYMRKSNDVAGKLTNGGGTYLEDLRVHDSDLDSSGSLAHAFVGAIINSDYDFYYRFMDSIFASSDDTLRAHVFSLMDSDLSYVISLYESCENDPYVFASNPDGVMTSFFIADLIATYYDYPNDVTSWMTAIANDSTIFHHPDYVGASENGAMAPVFRNALSSYANHDTLSHFFDDWSRGSGYLDSVTDPEDLILVVYNDSSAMFLRHGESQLGLGFINDAISHVEGINYYNFINLYSKFGTKLGDIVMNVENGGGGTSIVLKTEHYNLSEHHMYGSSRLGIKGYWPSQLYSDWDYTNSPLVADTILFKNKLPWYSAEYQDGINPHVTTPYLNTFISPAIVQHLLGQKQYEVTDHLGNVMITASDKKYALAYDTDSIMYYKPELPATYDYYPFGMLMPGRYTQDTTTQCATISQTIYVPVSTTYDESASAMSPQTIGIDATLDTLSEEGYLGVVLTSETEIIPGGGAKLTLPHVGINERNQLTFSVGMLSPDVEFIAQLYECNIDDTVLLADALLDRGEDYELDYKPTGTGNLMLKVLFKRGTVLFGPPLTSAGIYLNNFVTTITGYEPQEVTSTICSEGQDKYRFGFNGKEKDNEMKGVGNSLDFGARIYDSRLGRFLNIDPLSVKFAWYSPFLFAGNKPITHIDVNGLEEYWTAGGQYLGKYGENPQVRVVNQKYIHEAMREFSKANLNSEYFEKTLLNSERSHFVLPSQFTSFGNLIEMASQWEKMYNPKSIQFNKEYGSTLYGMSLGGKVYINFSEPNIGPPNPGSDDLSVEPSPPISSQSTLFYITRIHSHARGSGTLSGESFSYCGICKNDDGTNDGTRRGWWRDKEFIDNNGRGEFLATPSRKLKFLAPNSNPNGVTLRNNDKGEASKRQMKKWDKELDKKIQSGGPSNGPENNMGKGSAGGQ